MFAEIRLPGNLLDVGKTSLDIPRIIRLAQVEASALIADGSYYSIASATPAQGARIIDAIFRYHCGIRPFSDERNYYAVGAEW